MRQPHSDGITSPRPVEVPLLYLLRNPALVLVPSSSIRSRSRASSERSWISPPSACTRVAALARTWCLVWATKAPRIGAPLPHLVVFARGATRDRGRPICPPLQRIEALLNMAAMRMHGIFRWCPLFGCQRQIGGGWCGGGEHGFQPASVAPTGIYMRRRVCSGPKMRCKCLNFHLQAICGICYRCSNTCDQTQRFASVKQNPNRYPRCHLGRRWKRPKIYASN
jgi:hypothetical protein